MTKLRVKPGQRYFLAGKEYKAGEIVDVQDERFVKLLTMPKGPLEQANVRKAADLPKAAYDTRNMQASKTPLAPAPEKSPAPQQPPAAIQADSTVSEQEDNPGRSRRSRYQRSDMRPTEE